MMCSNCGSKPSKYTYVCAPCKMKSGLCEDCKKTKLCQHAGNGAKVVDNGRDDKGERKQAKPPITNGFSLGGGSASSGGGDRGLCTIDQILEAREWAKQNAPKCKAPPSGLSLPQSAMGLSNGSSMCSFNLPPAYDICSVMVFNVQTFFPSRISEKSPLLKVVIADLLEALNIDLASFLEARNDPYINMNYIEWAFDHDDDLRDDAADRKDDGKMDAKSDRSDAALEALAGLDGKWAQLASPMTGKVFRPPELIPLWQPFERMKCAALLEVRAHADLGARRDLNKTEQARANRLNDKIRRGCEGLAKSNSKTKDGRVAAAYKWALEHVENPQACDFAAQYLRAPQLDEAHTFYHLSRDEDHDAPKKKGSAQELAWAYWFRDEKGIFQQYYDCYVDDNEVDVEDLIARDEEAAAKGGALELDLSRVTFRLKRCDLITCDKPLGERSTCRECGPFAPGTTLLENLAQELQQVTKTGYQGPNLESYAVVYRQSSNKMPSIAGAFCGDRHAIVYPLTACLLTHGVQQMSGCMPSLGPLLPYQRPSAFYGRCPYSFSMELQPAGFAAPITMPLVMFHGPFGGDGVPAVQARADALSTMLEAGRYGMTAQGVQCLKLKEYEHAVAMGDYNLDYDPDDSSRSAKKKIAKKVYGKMEEAGFHPQLLGTCTSLLALPTGAKKKKMAELLPDGTCADFLSSRYDNILVKSGGDCTLHAKGVVANACAVDMIDFMMRGIKAGRYKLPTGNDDAEQYAKMSLAQQAFYLYRKYVSDHLPLIFDVVVSRLPPPEAPRAAPDVTRFKIKYDMVDVVRTEVRKGGEHSMTFGRNLGGPFLDIVGVIKERGPTILNMVTTDGRNTFEWLLNADIETDLIDIPPGALVWARITKPTIS